MCQFPGVHQRLAFIYSGPTLIRSAKFAENCCSRFRPSSSDFRGSFGFDNRRQLHSRTRKLRLPRNAPCCTANKNDWERIQSKASDSMLNAGRFFQTSTGQAVLWGGLVWLVLTGRIGWLFDSFLILLVVLSVVPVVGFLALRWWLNRQLMQGTCPSCGSAVTGLRNQPFQCMVCGQVVRGEEQGDFSVNDPSSATIDIDAKSID